MSTLIKKNGVWVKVAGHTVWTGTKAQLTAALEAGELPDGTEVMVTNDYESISDKVVLDLNQYQTAHENVSGNIVTGFVDITNRILIAHLWQPAAPDGVNPRSVWDLSNVFEGLEFNSWYFNPIATHGILTHNVSVTNNVITVRTDTNTGNGPKYPIDAKYRFTFTKFKGVQS